MSSRLPVFALAAGALGALGISSAAHAALLTYDLRVSTTGNSAGVVRTDAKHVVVAGAGNVVHLELHAVLDDGSLDADSTNDGITTGAGSFRSGTGGLLGNIGGGAIPSNLQGTGFSTGTSQDLDSDTDLDLGSNSTAAPATLDFFIVRTTGTNPVAGTDALLGTADFTVGALGLGATTLNFTPAVMLTGVPATQRNVHLFTIDGVSYIKTGSSTADVSSGSDIIVTALAVPEPATMGLLAIAAVPALAGRRRR